ncbi:MAG: acetate--CoA ligase family protein [bacterium]
MLDNFFNPRAVAIIGAAREQGKVGYEVLNNILKGGYKGRVYPVNPKASEILGVKVYRNIKEINDKLDLAVIIVPAAFVSDTLKDCGQKGIEAAIVITAGFKEAGIEGAKLEKEFLEIARENGIRILGPNCLGLINTYCNLNASFATNMPKKGDIAFFSQSGALGTAILDWAIGEGIGFSKVISLGNKADISEVEMLEVLMKDNESKVILGYLEGVTNGAAFMQAARMASKIKPVIITKSGSTAAGSRAASSHTGTLAGSEEAFKAAFKQTGIIRANTIRELFDYALAFVSQPIPQGDRLAIVTNAGGPGIIAADASEKAGIKLASFRKTTIDYLRSKLPPSAAVYNPVDIIGDARTDRYRESISTVYNDPDVDGLLVILTPQAMTEIEETAKEVVKITQTHKKTVLSSFMGEYSISQGKSILREGNVPNYLFPDEAVNTFKTMVSYNRWINRPLDTYKEYEVDKQRVKDVLIKAREEEQITLGETQARYIIEAYGFHVPANKVAETSKQAIEFAEQIGYPIVMKIASPDILHKSDIGGVKVGVTNAKDVEYNFQKIVSNAKKFFPNANIYGIAIQKMEQGGKEVIIGMNYDQQFGPLIMFGMGGIYVEVLKDVSFRIAPVSVEEAASMIREIRLYPLLRGIRGEKTVDIEAIEEAILRLSQLVIDFPELIEADINPLIVRGKGEGSVALDARFTLRE